MSTLKLTTLVLLSSTILFLHVQQSCSEESVTIESSLQTQGQTQEEEEQTSPSGGPCEKEGLFPHPINCYAYFRCVEINNRLYPSEHNCQSGTYFSPDHRACLGGSCPEIIPEKRV